MSHVMDRYGIDEQTYEEIVTFPPLFAETLLQSPKNPQDPLALRPYQYDVLSDRSQRRILRMGRRCISKEDVVHTSQGDYRAEDLFALYQKVTASHLSITQPSIYTVNDDLQVYRTPHWEMYDNGIRPTIQVTTRSGKQSTVSADHPFMAWTSDGIHWIAARDLRSGMHVAVVDFTPRNLTWEPIESVRDWVDMPTYDLHVPGTEAFVANQMVQHNTGKSVTLAVEGIYEGFTRSNAEIMLVTAYDSQIETLFNLMHRMALDSPAIKDSIARTRRKPHEIWFKNGSVVFGQVASPSVRGKCLVEGTMVWMGDGTWKPIERVEAGDKVYSLNIMTDQVESVEVRARLDQGLQEVYYLHNASARELVGTYEHPVLTPRGWKSMGDLITKANAVKQRADFVATVNVFGQRLWSRAFDVGAYDGEAHVYDLDVPPHCNFIAMHPRELDYQGFEKTKLSYGGYVVHNSANVLIIDEADYITQDLMLADVWPIATTYSDTMVVLSSTPSGRREFFWQISTYRDKPEYQFKEHHIPSTRSPEWTKEQESLARETTSKQQFQREYLAEFGEEAEGVFKNKDIDACLAVFGYEALQQNPNNFYTLGVDWNQPQHGVQAVILEYLNDPATVEYWNLDIPGTKNQTRREKDKFRVFWAGNIDADDYDQTGAVNWILDVMSKLKIDFASFDHGHGYTNYQLLRKCINQGFNVDGAPLPKRLKKMLEKMEMVDFGSKQEIIDVSTNEISKAKKKNYMVKLAQRIMESHAAIIPAHWLTQTPQGEERRIVENDEKKLIGQMRQYQIERIGQSGEVYSSTNDHRLDAFLLAIYSYGEINEEFQTWLPGIEHRQVESLIQPAVASAQMMRRHRQLRDMQQVQIHRRGDTDVTDYGAVPGGRDPELDNPGRRPRIKGARSYGRQGNEGHINMHGFHHRRRKT